MFKKEHEYCYKECLQILQFEHSVDSSLLIKLIGQFNLIFCNGDTMWQHRSGSTLAPVMVLLLDGTLPLPKHVLTSH